MCAGDGDREMHVPCKSFISLRTRGCTEKSTRSSDDASCAMTLRSAGRSKRTVRVRKVVFCRGMRESAGSNAMLRRKSDIDSLARTNENDYFDDCVFNFL